MPNQVRIQTSAPGTKQAASELDQLRDKYRKLSNELRESGAKNGAAFGLAAGTAAKGVDIIGNAAYRAGQAVGDFIHDSIDAASDLNESVSKSSVVFGEAADGVAEWGKTAATSMGMSKQAAIEAAATLGNLFTGLGKTKAEAADMSESMVQLAGDLGSFNNIDPTEALEKLRSGLSGEAEPLRSMGVFLTEAKVKAKAMEMGLADAHGELSEGAKVMARYQLILDETKTAQGDFSRTSDGLANSQRIVNAQLKDAEAELGEKLLPLQLKWTQLQRDAIPVLGNVATGVDGLVGSLEGYAQAVKWLSEHSPSDVLFGGSGGPAVGRAESLRDSVISLTAANKTYGDVAVAQAQRYSTATLTAGNSVVDSTADMKDAVIGYAATAASAFAKATHAAHGHADTLLADAQKLVDDYYDVIITQDQLVATNAEITAQRRILASSKSTKAEKADAKSRLHELEKTQKDLETDLASHGATTSKAFKDTMADLLKRLKGAHGDERTAILNEIKALNLLAFQASVTSGQIHDVIGLIGGAIGKTFGGGWGKPGKAAGGPVKRGEAYTVGEMGAETFVPASDGTIIPHGAPAAGGGWTGGGSVTFAPTVVIQGVATPATNQAIITQLGPLFAGWLKANGWKPG